MPTTPPRRAARRVWAAAAAVAVALSTGCGTASVDTWLGGGPTDVVAVGDAPAPAAPAPLRPTEPPTAREPGASAVVRPPVPEVPVRSAALGAADRTAPVPPVRVSLPAAGIEVPVEPVGVAADGQMEIPPHAEVGGWYRYGAAPGGSSGTAVVAAHVDSVASAGLGPFARLRHVAAGDLVDVRLADGSTRQYVVVSVSATPKPQVAWEDVFTRDGAHRLVLVTCGGTFQRDVRSYTDNVIVTAEPMGT